MSRCGMIVIRNMLNKAKDVATKSYSSSMLEWKDHSTAHPPYNWITSQSWHRLVDHWCSDRFASRSLRNASNRALGENSGAATGSVNMLVHKQCFEQTQGRELRWSDELFQPTHTSKKTREFFGKANRTQDRYERAMVQKYMERTEPHGPVMTATSGTLRALMIKMLTAITMVVGALGTTRCMFRHGGSSSTRSPSSQSSQSYSSMLAASNLTDADIDKISSWVYDRMATRFTAQIIGEIMPQLTEKISLALRAAQENSSSHSASLPPPQDDDDDDKEQWSNAGDDSTA